MKFIIPILFLFSLNFVFAKENKLTKTFLITSYWDSDPEEDQGRYLTFYGNDTFKINCHGECGTGSFIGKYKITENKVYLELTEKTDDFKILEFKNKYLILLVDESHPICTHKLVSTSDKNFEFYRSLSKVQPGMTRNINGNLVKMIKRKDIKVKNGTRIRKGPGIRFEPYELLYKKQTTTECYLDKPMIILGRNNKKETIKGFTDYWYFVHIFWDMYSEEDGPSYGWIHGSVIK